MPRDVAKTSLAGPPALERPSPYPIDQWMWIVRSFDRVSAPPGPTTTACAWIGTTSTPGTAGIRIWIGWNGEPTESRTPEKLRKKFGSAVRLRLNSASLSSATWAPGIGIPVFVVNDSATAYSSPPCGMPAERPIWKFEPKFGVFRGARTGVGLAELSIVTGKN